MNAQISPAGSAGAEQAESDQLNLDLAWRAHTAQENWTGKVDAKASIFLTVNGAVLGSVLAIRAQKDSYLAQLGGWHEALLWVALVLCGLATAVAGAVIWPLLGRTRPAPGRGGTIYFGDLRGRRPAELAAQLRAGTPDEHFAQLSRQLVRLARINWFKHRALQVALAAGFLGYLLLFVVLAA